MREVLFKAKRVDNNEWVKGYYVKAEKLDGSGFEHFIIEESKDGATHKIIPETLCQFTGLCDKNGKRIWEWDIVKFGDIIGIINYSTGCYCVKTNKPDWRSRNNPAIDIIINEYPNEMEIISNINDNSELLTTERSE